MESSYILINFQIEQERILNDFDENDDIDGLFNSYGDIVNNFVMINLWGSAIPINIFLNIF
jgi:hypothetical protein